MALKLFNKIYLKKVLDWAKKVRIWMLATVINAELEFVKFSISVGLRQLKNAWYIWNEFWEIDMIC